jgi:hypothetical protein
MNRRLSFAITALLFTLLGCANSSREAPSQFAYTARVLDGIVNVKLDTAKSIITVLDLGKPAYFCGEKDDHFCVRSEHLSLEIPRASSPVRPQSWERNGNLYSYEGTESFSFRGIARNVHVFRSVTRSFGVVVFYIDRTLGLIAFRVTLAEGEATYELDQKYAIGYLFFDGLGSDRWRKP